jgi:predicted dehydrogenase
LWRRGDQTLQQLAGGELRALIGDVQAGFALYGNGLYNTGSHLVDMVRMLLGDIVEVTALSELQSERKSPIPRDHRLAFSLRLNSGVVVGVHSLDFGHYREVGLDLWGTTGRLQIAHEGLGLYHFPKAEHRALDAEFEVACDRPRSLDPGAGEALYVLYSNLAQAIRTGVPLLSPISSALKTEAVLDAVLSSASRQRSPYAVK